MKYLYIAIWENPLEIHSVPSGVEETPDGAATRMTKSGWRDTPPEKILVIEDRRSMGPHITKSYEADVEFSVAEVLANLSKESPHG